MNPKKNPENVRDCIRIVDYRQTLYTKGKCTGSTKNIPAGRNKPEDAKMCTSKSLHELGAALIVSQFKIHCLSLIILMGKNLNLVIG
jgi:hypothetical protein